MTFQTGNAKMVYGAGFCKSLRTYNTVPIDAPIVKACQRFDLLEVRRLFEAGLASPLDAGDLGTPIQMVSFFIFTGCSTRKSIYKGLELMRFLIACLGGEIREQLWLSYCFLAGSLTGINEQDSHAQVEAFRLGLVHSSEYPIDNYLKRLMTIEFSRTPFYASIVAQEKWWVDTEIDSDVIAYENFFAETDLQMLADPSGLSLQNGLLDGRTYIPIGSHYKSRHVVNAPLHSLLKIVFDARDYELRDDLHECVIARLTILLQANFDPRALHQLHQLFHFTTSSQAQDYPIIHLSCEGCAVYLNQASLWREALRRAGWNANQIQDLSDENFYAGVPELLDGTLDYQTRNEQRKQFIETLRRGGFAALDEDETSRLIALLEFELDLHEHKIYYMIEEVTTLLNQRAIPGGWRDEEEITLIPGIDFKLPRDHEHGDVEDWKCIREIWDKELDGCIPDGYSSSDFSDDSTDDEEY